MISTTSRLTSASKIISSEVGGRSCHRSLKREAMIGLSTEDQSGLWIQKRGKSGWSRCHKSSLGSSNKEGKTASF